MSFKTIYNMKLAGYLMNKGFVLMNMDKNNDGSGRKVFFFKNSAEINKAIDEYLTQKSNN